MLLWTLTRNQLDVATPGPDFQVQLLSFNSVQKNTKQVNKMKLLLLMTFWGEGVVLRIELRSLISTAKLNPQPQNDDFFFNTSLISD